MFKIFHCVSQVPCPAILKEMKIAVTNPNPKIQLTLEDI